MNKTKFIRNQWAGFSRQWMALINAARLSLAITLADFKYRASGGSKQYFVLPDEVDRLLVLTLDDIEKLKSIQEVKFRVKFRRQVYNRKRKGSNRKKKIIRLKIIGRKAFGISRMSRKVTELDVRKECFYHTPLKGSDALPAIEEQKKGREWIQYAWEARFEGKDKVVRDEGWLRMRRTPEGKYYVEVLNEWWRWKKVIFGPYGPLGIGSTFYQHLWIIEPLFNNCLAAGKDYTREGIKR